MTKRTSFSALTCATVLGLLAVFPIAAGAQTAAPLSLTSAKVSIAGTSNIHEWSASTTNVAVTKLTLESGVSGAGILAAALNPGTVTAFEVAVRTKSLASPKEGVDKNMHKALKADEFADITFRLLRFESKAPGATRAVGMLKIAGVEKEVAFDLKTAAAPTTLTVSGEVALLMTDYGITPPRALMGMLKTDPKVVVKFETVFAMPTTY